MTFVIRSERAGTEGFLNEMRQAVWSVNSNLPLASVRTMQDVYDKSVARTSFTLVMLGIAGTMALVLGIIGIYGVMSYTVSQRKREIGIRLALGAQGGDVLQMVLRQGAKMALVGVAIGIGAALALTRLMTQPVIWRDGARSADICRGCCPAHLGCALGVLHSRSPCDTRRSDRGASLRIALLFTSLSSRFTIRILIETHSKSARGRIHLQSSPAPDRSRAIRKLTFANRRTALIEPESRRSQ